MFGRLRRTLEEALSKLEARGGSSVQEDVDRLLHAMREELIQAKAQIPEFEAHVEVLKSQRAAERERAKACVRRASQAEAIDDRETQEVAERFAKQHLSRAEVLDHKIEAARAELELRRTEVAEMTAQLKDAVVGQDALTIQARRARTIETTRGGGTSALEEFERLAERMSRPSELEAAERELDEELGMELGMESESPDDPELTRLTREARAEELLEELKRRMDEEGS